MGKTRLACECCEFDSKAVYGELGRGFAECHHRRPLRRLVGKTVTRLEDLAIVCANCVRPAKRLTQSVTQLAGWYVFTVSAT